jgi:tetratricopeptide (TPR) repeat protein
VLIHAILLLQLIATPTDLREAERLVHASMSDYDLGFFDKALHEAEDAYRRDPLPLILFNIGQCHRALEHWEKAAFYFRRYLQKLPDAPNRALVESLLTAIDYKLKAQQLPAPAPAPVVVVAAPPPPASSPATPVSIAPTALEASVTPPHSHTTAWVLGAVTLACVAVAVVGIVEVQSYESLRGQLATERSYTQWQRDSTTVLGEASGATSWEVAAITAGAAALATGTGAVLTW